MGLLRCNTNPKKWRATNYNRNVVNSFTVGLVVASFGVLFSIAEVRGALSLTKQCGEEVVCQALEYCRPHDFTCHPCTDVCDSDGHNFDESRCVSDCQDYIHDGRYLNLHNSTLLALQRAELEEKYKDLEKDVLVLKVVVGVCVAVIVFVVACLLAFFVYFWKLMHPAQPGDPEEKKKPAANKSASVELPTVYNNRYGVTTPTPETSPSSVISSSPADTNITTISSSTIPPYHAHSPTPPPLAARSSPTKSESSVTTPGTATTILMSSAASTLVNGGIGGRNVNVKGNMPADTKRFRREPSESTLPDNCAYDNLSMSPQHCHYSHHV